MWCSTNPLLKWKTIGLLHWSLFDKYFALIYGNIDVEIGQLCVFYCVWAAVECDSKLYKNTILEYARHEIKSINFNGIMHFLERYWNFVCTPQNALYIIFDLVIYLPTYLFRIYSYFVRPSFNLLFQTAFGFSFLPYLYGTMCVAIVHKMSWW